MLAPRVLRPRCPACRFDATNTAKALNGQSPFRLPPPWSTSIQVQAQILALASKPQQSRRFYQSEDEIRERLRRARPLLSDRSANRFVNTGRSTSSRAFVIACVAAAVAFYFFNSQTVPGTGRRRFNFLSDWLVEQLGRRGAAEVVQEIREQGGRFISERDRRFLLIKSVMARLVPVSGMADVDWKIMLVDDDSTVNAFVTPGGHLFVFSGILRVCGNPDALAAVLGHEVAHNVAAHNAERMSAACIGNLTSASLFMLAGLVPGLLLGGMWFFTGGWYLQNLLFDLPMSRKMESEADYIGLMMMAEACYDPSEAVRYWIRMAKVQHRGGHEVPELLSTHPSNDHRIKKMQEWLPQALEKRKESDCTGSTGAWAQQFRDTIIQRQRIRL